MLKYACHTWWFIIARRHSIHKCTSSSASPKFIFDEKREYIVKRFFIRIDWWGFRVSPWRSRANEALCFSEERLPFASANEELLALVSLCIKLQINVFYIQQPCVFYAAHNAVNIKPQNFNWLYSNNSNKKLSYLQEGRPYCIQYTVQLPNQTADSYSNQIIISSLHCCCCIATVTLRWS